MLGGQSLQAMIRGTGLRQSPASSANWVSLTPPSWQFEAACAPKVKDAASSAAKRTLAGSAWQPALERATSMSIEEHEGFCGPSTNASLLLL